MAAYIIALSTGSAADIEMTTRNLFAVGGTSGMELALGAMIGVWLLVSEEGRDVPGNMPRHIGSGRVPAPSAEAGDPFGDTKTDSSLAARRGGGRLAYPFRMTDTATDDVPCTRTRVARRPRDGHCS